jgi:hypothetical protein
MITLLAVMAQANEWNEIAEFARIKVNIQWLLYCIVHKD